MIRSDWLDRYALGLQELTAEERDAITHFTFLWTMFEARVLGTRASANTILVASRRWAGKGLLSADTFGHEVAYFRHRYVVDGNFTSHFTHLHFRRHEARALVKKVLAGEDMEPEKISAAVLIIVYRLRNNLFHGVKWSYGLQGQLENFTQATAALMRAIELHEKAESGMPA